MSSRRPNIVMGFGAPQAKSSGGIEFGNFGGRIGIIGNLALTPASQAKSAPDFDTARSGKLLIAGYATRYDKVHVYKGGFELFRPGVFAQTILAQSQVRLLEDHDESKLLAATGGHGLKIWSDDVELAFKASLPDNEATRRVHAAVKSGEKCMMSVGYEKIDFETKSIASEDVLFIRAARLNELSIVEAGAVKQAYAVCMDHDDGEPYRETKSTADCLAAANAVSAAIDRTRRFLKGAK